MRLFEAFEHLGNLDRDCAQPLEEDILKSLVMLAEGGG